MSTTEQVPGADVASAEEAEIRGLYHALLVRWNEHDAAGFAGLFAEDGNVIGFDGSPINGRAAIAAELQAIFANHVTAAYVAEVREVRFLTADVAVLRAVAGLVPPGQRDLNPGVNALQTLVAARHDGSWRIELYQNTPAAFHGRPELSAALTAELRALLP